MVEYNKVKVKLSDSQLNNLKTAIKNDTRVTLIAQKMKLSIRNFFSKCETADLVTFTEEILNGKLYFLCSI